MSPRQSMTFCIQITSNVGSNTQNPNGFLGILFDDYRNLCQCSLSSDYQNVCILSIL